MKPFESMTVITSAIVLILITGADPSKHFSTFESQWHSFNCALVLQSSFLNFEHNTLHSLST